VRIVDEALRILRAGVEVARHAVSAGRRLLNVNYFLTSVTITF
jgi:hypothetical protein